MNFIVVGCGRVGAELSHHLFKRGHQVVAVDSNKEAFNRLHPDFRGRTLEGEGLEESVLARAGIRILFFARRGFISQNNNNNQYDDREHSILQCLGKRLTK